MPKPGVTEYYDTQGYLMERLDAAGRVTQYDYDNAQPHNLLSVTGPSGTRYEIRRGDNQAISIVAVEEKRETVLRTYHFDTSGRLIQSQTPDGYTVHYAYNIGTSFLNRVTQSDGTSVSFFV